MKDNDKERIYCVYKHTSPIGKSYIGITSMNPPSKTLDKVVNIKVFVHRRGLGGCMKMII